MLEPAEAWAREMQFDLNVVKIKCRVSTGCKNSTCLEGKTLASREDLTGQRICESTLSLISGLITYPSSLVYSASN